MKSMPSIWLLFAFIQAFAEPPYELMKRMIETENMMLACKTEVFYGRYTKVEPMLNRLSEAIDSLLQHPELPSYHTIQNRVDEMVIELKEMRQQLSEREVQLKVDKLKIQSSSELKRTTIAEPKEKSAESTETTTVLLAQLNDLIQDTAEMSLKIRDISKQNETLNTQLQRYTTGIFFGLGFGYNYFVNAPNSYYVKPDSTLGRYGRSTGMSFILSGFLAYKITPKHSVIFNVPLGDITNRDDFRVGLFNKKMAGGLGYGYNLGNVSIICIINVSPYEEVEYRLIENEKFDEARFATLDINSYPSSTRYSPSFTFGLSYNFIAPERFLFEGF